MIGGLFFGRLHAVLFWVLMALTAVCFVFVPLDRELPVHWDITGQPDRYFSAPLALLIAPGMAVFLIAVLAVVGRLQTPEQREAGRHINQAVMVATTGIALVLQAVMLRIGLGFEVDVARTITFCMAVLFIVLGNVLPKSQRNVFAGIRVPPTLADPRNWQATHRFGGRLFMAAGIALALLAVFVTHPGILAAGTIAAALLPSILSVIYSYRYKP